jgi:hypothetical protein
MVGGFPRKEGMERKEVGSPVLPVQGELPSVFAHVPQCPRAARVACR